MRRSLMTLTMVLALSMWAGAQGPPAQLPAATQRQLFGTNQALLVQLVDQGVEVADADRPLKRAEVCGKTALKLSQYLAFAAEDQNPERVTELAGLMSDVVRDGLVPNLSAAQKEIRAGDPNETRLIQLRDTVYRDLEDLPGRVQSTGKVADNQKVKDALEALAALRTSIKKP